MKVKLLLALLPAVCICLPANLIHAQQNPDVTTRKDPPATGRHYPGVLQRIHPARLSGAKIEIEALFQEFKRSQRITTSRDTLHSAGSGGALPGHRHRQRL